MLIIALTGGIGSGKTTVSEIFKSKNIPVIDTDLIARQIVEKDEPEYNKIIKLFGKKILNKDKNIDRSALGKLIFSSKEKRLQLEKLLHPVIWNTVASKIKVFTSSLPIPAYCIIVVPLLLENITKIKPVTFDRILVIDVDEETQIKRSKKRDNCDETLIKNIMKNQVSRQIRIDAADDIILNSDDFDSLNKKIEKLHQQYQLLAKNITK
jgi:dephospho-CoA kinase